MLLSGTNRVGSIKVVWDLLQNKKSVRDKNIRAWKLDGLPRQFLMVNPKYAQCDWHEKHVQQIAVRTVKRMVDKEGLYVIGLIEETIRNYLRYGDPSLLFAENAITEEWIKSLMDAYLVKNSELLKEPEDLADFECRDYFSELISAKRPHVRRSQNAPLRGRICGNRQKRGKCNISY